MAAVAAVIQHKEREIVNTFRGAGATSPDRARDPGELGVGEHLAFERLVKRAVLREAGGGKYYLDELSWNALRGLRRRMVFVVLLIMIIVLIALGMMGAFIPNGARPA